MPYTQMPQDARLIALIIASMGIQDIEPGVEMMLLEWAHRYIHTVLSDTRRTPGFQWIISLTKYHGLLERR